MSYPPCPPARSYRTLATEHEALMQKYLHLLQVVETEKTVAKQLRQQIEDGEMEIERLKAEVTAGRAPGPPTPCRGRLGGGGRPLPPAPVCLARRRCPVRAPWRAPAIRTCPPRRSTEWTRRNGARGEPSGEPR